MGRSTLLYYVCVHNVEATVYKMNFYISIGYFDVVTVCINIHLFQLLLEPLIMCVVKKKNCVQIVLRMSSCSLTLWHNLFVRLEDNVG